MELTTKRVNDSRIPIPKIVTRPLQIAPNVNKNTQQTEPKRLIASKLPLYIENKNKLTSPKMANSALKLPLNVQNKNQRTIPTMAKIDLKQPIYVQKKNEKPLHEEQRMVKNSLKKTPIATKKPEKTFTRAEQDRISSLICLKIYTRVSFI